MNEGSEDGSWTRVDASKRRDKPGANFAPLPVPPSHHTGPHCGPAANTVFTPAVTVSHQQESTKLAVLEKVAFRSLAQGTDPSSTLRAGLPKPTPKRLDVLPALTSNKEHSNSHTSLSPMKFSALSPFELTTIQGTSPSGKTPKSMKHAHAPGRLETPIYPNRQETHTTTTKTPEGVHATASIASRLSSVGVSHPKLSPTQLASQTHDGTSSSQLKPASTVNQTNVSSPDDKHGSSSVVKKKLKSILKRPKSKLKSFLKHTKSASGGKLQSETVNALTAAASTPAYLAGASTSTSPDGQKFEGEVDGQDAGGTQLGSLPSRSFLSHVRAEQPSEPDVFHYLSGVNCDADRTLHMLDAQSHTILPEVEVPSGCFGPVAQDRDSDPRSRLCSGNPSPSARFCHTVHNHWGCARGDLCVGFQCLGNAEESYFCQEATEDPDILDILDQVLKKLRVAGGLCSEPEDNATLAALIKAGDTRSVLAYRLENDDMIGRVLAELSRGKQLPSPLFPVPGGENEYLNRMQCHRAIKRFLAANRGCVCGYTIRIMDKSPILPIEFRVYLTAGTAIIAETAEPFVVAFGMEIIQWIDDWAEHMGWFSFDYQAPLSLWFDESGVQLSCVDVGSTKEFFKRRYLF